MPEELRTRLTELSRESGRSLHAEIIAILQEAADSGTSRAIPRLNIDTLAEALATKLATKLTAEMRKDSTDQT